MNSRRLLCFFLLRLSPCITLSWSVPQVLFLQSLLSLRSQLFLLILPLCPRHLTRTRRLQGAQSETTQVLWNYFWTSECSLPCAASVPCLGVFLHMECLAAGTTVSTTTTSPIHLKLITKGLLLISELLVDVFSSSSELRWGPDSLIMINSLKVLDLNLDSALTWLYDIEQIYLNALNVSFFIFKLLGRGTVG